MREFAASSGSLRFLVWMEAARSNARPASLPAGELDWGRVEDVTLRHTLLLHSECIRRLALGCCVSTKDGAVNRWKWDVRRDPLHSRTFPSCPRIKKSLHWLLVLLYPPAIAVRYKLKAERSMKRTFCRRARGSCAILRCGAHARNIRERKGCTAIEDVKCTMSCAMLFLALLSPAELQACDVSFKRPTL